MPTFYRQRTHTSPCVRACPYLAIFNFAVRIRDHLQKFHNVVMGEGSKNADFPDGSDGKATLCKGGKMANIAILEYRRTGHARSA